LTGAVRIASALLCVGGLAAAVPAATVTLVHAGTLLAVPGVPPRDRQTLVIRDGRIAEIRDGFLAPADVEAPAGAEVLDLSDEFVLPGLIDLHVHLTTEVEGGEALRAVTRTAADLALVARRHAQETLRAGFTTVLDLGTGRADHEQAIFALRSAVNAGIADGPRILAVGSPIAPTGSSRTDRFTDDVDKVVGPQNVCDGAMSCANTVREQIRRGADAIVFYDSGSLRDADLAGQVFTDEEMRAVVATAHSLNRKVIADGHTAAGMNAAIRAGADVLDTAPWPDAETWKLLQGRNVYFEGHMHAFVVASGLTSPAGDVGVQPEPPVAARVRSVMAKPFSAQVAHEHGVALAYGSDTGIVNHGDNAGDLGELVRMGLTPMQAIEVATIQSAAAVGWGAEIGTLEVGKSADLVAVQGNPLNDIHAVRAVRYVMRAGRGLRVQ
jgi:imidazolonepropionase-like amidohydrolase